MRKKKKHSYLLLEVLIAIALVSLFAGPMLRSPVSALERHTKELLQIRLHKEGYRTLSQVEDGMREGKISWEDLEKSVTETVILHEEILSGEIRKRVSLSGTKMKSLESGIRTGTVGITVEFFSRGKTGRLLHKAEGIRFVAKKGPDPALVPLPYGKEPICREKGS